MASSQEQQTVVGTSSNFWLHSDKDGFDLTHPQTPSSPLVYPRLTLQTSTSPITIAPSKTALVIVDMQNYFLAPELGRKLGPGHEAANALLKYAIPAARKAGIQVIWLSWGITDEDLETMPPAVWRAFGFQVTATQETSKGDDDGHARANRTAPAVARTLKRIERKAEHGLGLSVGKVTLEDGTVIDGGRMLMADQWNTRLYGELENAHKEGLNAPIPDVSFRKTRMSGFWGGSTEAQKFLEDRGITTLLFTGVNTDQCVLGSLQDAYSKSWDTILLKDGCGTTSPEYAKEAVENNCHKNLGFLSSCEALAVGVEHIASNE